MEDDHSTSKFNIIEYSSNLVRQTKQIEEKNFIFIGDNKSGKSTIFNLIFSSKKEKDNKYSQTCGINFNNATVSFTNLNRKILLNGYELGGSLENIRLIKNIVFENNISNTTFVIIIDLNQPEGMLNSINLSLKLIYESLNQNIALETLQSMSKSKENKLRCKSDLNICEYVPWNVCVIGTKYDLFEKMDVEKIKWSCRVLRFFCHLYGFNLAFTKYTDEKIQNQIGSLIKTSASDLFSEMKIKHQIDHLQPLFIEFGKDSFEDIGEPKISKSSDGKLKTMWEDTLLSTFKDYSRKDNTFSNFDEKFLLLKYPEKVLDADLLQFEKRNNRINDMIGNKLKTGNNIDKNITNSVNKTEGKRRTKT